MAKKHTHHRSHSRAIVRVPTVRPIVIRTRSAATKHKKKHHKHHRGGLGGIVSSKQISTAMGGYGLGFIQKQFPNLPKIPMLGEAGTIAIASYMLRGKLPFAEEICTAALVVAGYQLATTGAITGGDYIAGQF
jgi:hypothetical protein